MAIDDDGDGGRDGLNTAELVVIDECARRAGERERRDREVGDFGVRRAAPTTTCLTALRRCRHWPPIRALTGRAP